MRWRVLRPAFWACPTLLLMITAAGAAAEKSTRPSEFIFIVQIVLLIAVGRGLGEIMQRIGQPSVIGELLAGLLLGPSLFGWLWPTAQTDYSVKASPWEPSIRFASRASIRPQVMLSMTT